MRIYLKHYDRDIFSDPYGDQDERSYQHEAGFRLMYFSLEHGRMMDDTKNTEYRYIKNQWGKPMLADYPNLQFNISHTAGMIACAVGNCPVGIDVERIRPYPKGILRKLSDGERDYILSSGNPDEAFMRVWTMKEAWIKMTGEGLSAFQKMECIPGREINGISYQQFLWQNSYIVTAMEQERLDE